MKVNGLDFWGAAFLEKEGHSAIGVVSKTPHWFPVSYMAEAVARISNIIKASRYSNVTTYGFSQGAYGALKFSRALGAARSIALSPQASITPKDVGHFDKNFLAHHLPGPHADMLIVAGDLCPTNYVLYDPFYQPDREHLRLITTAGPTAAIPVPFVDHYSANYCAETRTLSSIFRILHSGEPDAQSRVTQKLRSQRRTSWRYWVGRANASPRLRTGWTTEKYKTCRLALKMRPGSVNVKVTLAELLERDKKADEALTLLVAVKNQVAGATQSDILRAWQALRRLEAKEHALELVRAACEIKPLNPHLRLRAAMSLRELYRPNDAMAELEFAEASARNDGPVWVQIAAYWKALNRPDRADAAILRSSKS